MVSSSWQQELPKALLTTGASPDAIPVPTISRIDVQTEAAAILAKRGSGRRHLPRVPLAALAS